MLFHLKHQSIAMMLWNLLTRQVWSLSLSQFLLAYTAELELYYMPVGIDRSTSPAAWTFEDFVLNLERRKNQLKLDLNH